MIKTTHIIDLPGLTNVGIVEDGKIYRGARPANYETLKQLGIKTIINLEEFHVDNPPFNEFALVAYPMTVFAPDSGQVTMSLQAMRLSTNQPVYVHCQQGQDRTGLVCAAYRVKVQGWTVAQAWEEMQTYILSPIGEIWFPIRDAVMSLK
jgi:protein tyrosine/serine phosphatase